MITISSVYSKQFKFILLAVIILFSCNLLGQKLIIPSGQFGQYPKYKFSEDEAYLVSWTGNLDREIKLWETSTNREVDNFTGGSGGFWDVVIVSKLHELFGIDMSNTLWVWDTNTGEIIKSLQLNILENSLDIDSGITEIRIYSNTDIKVYDIRTLDLKRAVQIRSGNEAYSTGSPHFIKLSEGKTLESFDDSAFVLNKESLIESRFALSEKHNGTTVSMVSELKRLIILEDSYNKKLTAIDLDNFKLRWVLQLDDYPQETMICGNDKLLVHFLNKGNKLVSLSDGQLIKKDSLFVAEGKFFNKYSNDRYLIDQYPFDQLGKSKQIRIAIYDANSLLKVFDQRYSCGNVGFGGTMLITDKYFIYTSENIRPLQSGLYSTPCIFDLDNMHLNGQSEENRFSIFDAFSNIYRSNQAGIKGELDARTFKNFLIPNGATTLIVSSDLKYAIYNNYSDFKELLKVTLFPDSVATEEVKNLGYDKKSFDFSSFSEDDKHFAFIVDSTLFLGDIGNGEIIAKKKVFHVNMFMPGSLCAYMPADYFMMSQGDSLLNIYSYKQKDWSSIRFDDAIVFISKAENGSYIVTGKTHVYSLFDKHWNSKPILSESEIFSTVFDRDSTMIYCLMRDGSIRMINYKTGWGSTINAPELGLNYQSGLFKENVFSESTSHLLISSDRKYLLTHGPDNVIRIWDKAKKEVYFSTPPVKFVREIYFNTQNNLLILLSNGEYTQQNSVVSVYDWKSKQLLFNDSLEVAIQKAHPLPQLDSIIKNSLDVFVSVDNQLAQRKKINQLDFSRKVSIDYKKENLLISFENVVCYVQLKPILKKTWMVLPTIQSKISDDGDFIVNPNSSGFWLISTTNNETKKIKFNEDAYVQDFGSTNQFYYFVCQTTTLKDSISYNYHFRVYDKANSAFILDKEMPSSVSKTVVSDDGQYIAFYSSGTPGHDSAFIFDLKQAKLIKSFKGAFTNVVFSPGSQFLLAVQSDGFCYIDNLKTGKVYTNTMDEFKTYQLLDNGFLLNESTVINLLDNKKIISPANFVFGVDGNNLVSIKSYGEISLYDYKLDTAAFIPFQHSNELQECKLAPNKKYLLTLGYDNYLLKWDYSSGELIGRANVGFDLNRSLYYNSDSTFVIIYGNIKGTEYNINSLEPNFSFTTSLDQTLNYFLPTGYYITNKEDLERYYFNYEGSLYGFSQFDLLLNRPDTVLSSLYCGSAYTVQKLKNAYLKRIRNIPDVASRVKFEPEILPTVDIDNEHSLTQSDALDSIVHLKISAQDKTEKLYSLKVWVNNCSVFTSGHRILTNSKIFSDTLGIILSEGKNKIDVCCDNVLGLESLHKTIYVNYFPGKSKPGRTYFVGIGISRYKDKRNNLQFAAKDILDLDSLFKSKYPDLVSILFLDSAAKTESILKVREVLNKCSVDDKVIFAFSGHGLDDNKNSYFLGTYNSNFARPQEKGLSFDTLNNLLDEIPARRKLVLLDACNSGLTDKDTTVQEDRFAIALSKDNAETSQTAFDIMEDMFADITYGNGAIVISAARGNEYAQEGNSNGIFTQCFLQGALNNDADANNDGILKVSEMKSYVSKEVSRVTHNHQRPVSRQDNSEFDWALW